MKCPKCEQIMLWNSDCDFEDYGIEKEGVIGFYECKHNECDVTDVEIYTPIDATL